MAVASKGEQTRQAILDEATRLASRVGLSGLTIGLLATEMHLSKSGLFAHFGSKESLQLQVLANAEADFLNGVVLPALAAPRGEARLRELVDRWLSWTNGLPGGCPFVAASSELDDQPGPVRDRLVRRQRDWLESVGQMFATGVADGVFRDDADPIQFAQDLYGVLLAYQHMNRLLRDPLAEARARRAFEALLAAVRV